MNVQETSIAEKRPQEPASAPALPAAPQPQRPASSAQQRPAQAPGNGNGGRLSLTFRLTLEPGLTVASLMDIVRELPLWAELV